MGIKKKILLGWLAFEAVGLCIALPATAQMVDKVMFSAAPRAAHVVTPIAPGFTRNYGRLQRTVRRPIRRRRR